MANNNVRQRGTKNPHSSPLSPISPDSPLPGKSSPSISARVEADDQGRAFSPLDIVRVIFIISGILFATSYYLSSGESLLFGYKPWFTNPKHLAHWWQGPLTLTPEQLAQFNGTDINKPIYLAINGTIYDVTEGRSSYGPGGGYSVFAGRDATRAFVTGCFLEDRTGDLRGAEETYLPIEDVENEQIGSGERKTRAEREKREAKKRVLAEVSNWETFYRNSKKYFEVGKLLDTPVPNDAPLRPLCEHAIKGRPKRSKMNEGKNSSPGKPVQ